MSELDRTYTVAEVAQALGVTTYWLADRARLRQVPHLRLGRRVRFTAGHVAAIREQFERGPAPEPPVRLSPRSAAARRRRVGGAA